MQAELNRREAELRRLELEIRNNPGAKSTKNWPKFCPVVHHDIAGGWRSFVGICSVSDVQAVPAPSLAHDAPRAHKDRGRAAVLSPWSRTTPNGCCGALALSSSWMLQRRRLVHCRSSQPC